MRRLLIATMAVAALWAFGGVELSPSVAVSADTNCDNPDDCDNNGTGHRPSKKKKEHGTGCFIVSWCTVVFTEGGEAIEVCGTASYGDDC